MLVQHNNNGMFAVLSYSKFDSKDISSVVDITIDIIKHFKYIQYDIVLTTKQEYA